MTIVFGNQFHAWTILFMKTLFFIVAKTQKLFLILKLKESLHILRLFPRTLPAGPDISTFFLRSSGLTQLILSLLLITLYISIKSPLSRVSFKVDRSSLFNLSSYWSFPIQSISETYVFLDLGLPRLKNDSWIHYQFSWY